jgi:DedD protein
MSPDRDPGRPEDDGPEVDEYDDDAPRSIFSALWFRALLAVLVLGMLAAVAVPYVLDFATQPTLKSTTAAKSPATASPAATSPAPPVRATAAPAAPIATPAAPTAAPLVSTPAPSASTAAPAALPPTAAPAPARPAAPAVVAPAPPKPKPAPAVAERPAAAEKPRVAAARVADAPKVAPKPADASKPTPAKAAAPGGTYWVQVGAFKDGETAKRLVTRLREQGMRAEESTTATTTAARPAAAPVAGDSTNDRYDVVVSGAPTPEINAKLAAKGMTSETGANSVVVRPSLPLREAVALSRELADGGLNVQVRRVGGGPAPAAAAAPKTESRETLHRVRVGGFPDRAAALAASKQLEDKGYKTFIARDSR